MSKVTDTLAAVLAENKKTNDSLDNIDKDIAGTAKVIQDLKDQLAAGTLSQEDVDALAAIVKASADTAAKAKVEADKVPDPPPPPPPPGS